MTIEWYLETRKIKDLIPYEHNPRKATKQQIDKIKESIDAYGLIDRPIINLDNTIIAGHQRIAILKSRRAKQIEVWVPNRALTDEEVKDLNIRHNKATASWDFDLLANHFDVEELTELGFSEIELGLCDDEEIETAESTTTSSHCDIIIQFTCREHISDELIAHVKANMDKWGAINFKIK